MKSSAYISLTKDYSSATTESKAIIEDLRSVYKTSLESNTFYHKGKRGAIFGRVFLILVLGGLFVDSDIFLDVFGLVMNWNTARYLKEMCMIGIVLLVIYEIFAIFRLLYSKRIERYQDKISNVEKEVKERLLKMEQEHFYAESIAALMKGERIVEENPNDLGERIISLRKEIRNTTRQSVTIDKISKIAISIILYLLGAVIFLLHRDEWEYFSKDAVFWLGAMGIYYTFALDLIIINAGQYLGKWMRPVGCLLVLIYGIFLWMICCQHYEKSVASLSVIPMEAEPFLTVGNIVVVFEVLGMLITVLFANYLGMKTKWEGEGFDLVMYYGDTKTKTRGSVIFRSLLLIIFFSVTCKICELPLKEDLIGFLPFMWWVTIPLMKPFGSTLYLYFGRAKCIGMSFTLFGVFLSYYIGTVGTMGKEELIILGLSMVAYLFLGAIVYVLNLATPIFLLISPFI